MAVHEAEPVCQVGMFSRVQAPRVQFVRSSAREVDVMDEANKVEPVYQVDHDRKTDARNMFPAVVQAIARDLA